MTSLTIVLVEPRIPQNTGNIARLCACLGAKLYLVGELGFVLNDKHLARAGMDYIDRAIPEHVTEMAALNDTNPLDTRYYLSAKATKTVWDVSFPRHVTLVFGREDKGLPPALIQSNPDRAITLPMPGEGRSLNLSSAVAATAYEVLRQQQCVLQ
ncbi:MAG: tRNA (cytidine(34)-2'-O)-methyltransferase [Vampirovibrionales bacterium]|nr:tRNA (cytidine(34)-2'-O)-methyltransferase [Vampirovibrionales bacterium]